MTRLEPAELELWYAWKRASEAVRSAVADDIVKATGLSDPDFGILTRVVELGDGRLRQSELAASMGWHRSRLSHQLTRMCERGLVERREASGGVDVLVTARGRELADAARPVHADAVRAHLLSAIAPAQRPSFLAVLEALGRR
ncbi:MarR family winged helix-turn-helix transcriptional regulator [Tsukamurella sp. 8F]|uniref:MarR family winged helix-turn-helix transcriptional regulator n=1 Tax=unclassified Tsukamurella TaxID=2633480 RepID=UPI0023BA2E8F|nr:MULTISPECIES: MarR family winged helix-turn-helix transcriptional regulator [unclassified Tsukamurella]MDF0528808.1 MarR family winged helix-turn-helix transcriptional regulator [Tsukamurella sp. 8J]MDF0586643.1 MarR family winged helix-turn-helix transcriptional regulator [Tsukamurella sp. 8F]